MLNPQVVTLDPAGLRYDAALREGTPPFAGVHRDEQGNGSRGAACSAWAAGSLNIVAHERIGFFCSAQCPGAVILKTFDAISKLRDRGHVLMGGFHSPIEAECLEILLRGRQPVIWAPARSIEGMRLRPALRPAFDVGRLLILSAFARQHRRITAALAEERNRFVGALADRIFVAYAAPGSRTSKLVEQLHASGKEILTVDDSASRALLPYARAVQCL